MSLCLSNINTLKHMHRIVKGINAIRKYNYHEILSYYQMIGGQMRKNIVSIFFYL